LGSARFNKGIIDQNCPVIIQNDFVDIALTAHAIALSKEIFEKRNKQLKKHKQLKINNNL
jgi:hypothetical protein